MKFISTRGKSKAVTFLEAAETGLAPDGGLYMPDSFPSTDFTAEFDSADPVASLREVAKRCSRPFLSGSLSPQEIDSLIEDAINFDAPLVQLSEKRYVLELFHGPTLAFKDFGARFMARLFSAHRTASDKNLVILVATSGDTGGAVANGFYDLPGVHVCLLYPKGKVSNVQRKQMTTLGKNITALEINGTFDDCQKLVKTAFSDRNLNRDLRLSSANSINIARLLPQSFYYLHAVTQLKASGESAPVFIVPSGNFGNLTAGLFAREMGLPVHSFVAATNRNDVVPEFLEGKAYSPRASIQTISNAMDVGNPSNFDRIRHLFQGDDELIRREITGYAFDDDSTQEMIRQVFDEFGYTADPHTAVGLLAEKEYRKAISESVPAVVLSTAHPSKFPDVVEEETGRKIETPHRLKKATEKREKSIPLQADYDTLKGFLENRYG